MADSLVTAAERLGVPTDKSAGPETMPGARLWARWPRDRFELASEVLSRIMSLHDDVVVARNASNQAWRAWQGDWYYEGEFDETVGALAVHLADRESAGRNWQPLVANMRLRS